jgi:uncharacterized membrane protein
MDVLFMVWRVIHILLGVLWVGAIFMIVVFVGPAIADAGPDGAKVMGALVKRRVLNIVPTFAAITIVSGLWLYSRDSSGFQGEWLGSRMGMTLGTGAVLSLVGFVIGLTVMRPSTLRAVALGQSLAQLPEAERGAVMAQIQQLRGRAAMAGRVVAVLLILAVLTMAVARYV